MDGEKKGKGEEREDKVKCVRKMGERRRWIGKDRMGRQTEREEGNEE